MKINFFTYCLRRARAREDVRISFDLPGILRAFAQFDHGALKNSFKTPDGEHVYLLPTRSQRILEFLSTRSHDIIKAVGAGRLTAQDLRRRLREGESVAFSTFVYVDADFLAVACTQRGPKSGTFVRFVNLLIAALGGRNLRFCANGLGVQITRDRLKQLEFISQTFFEVQPTHSLAKTIAEELGIKRSNVRSMKITVTAKRGRDFSDDIGAVSKNVEDAGLSKFRVRAKAALQDDLTDYFLTDGDGQFSAEIAASSERAILDRLASEVSNKRNAVTSLLSESQNDATVLENGFFALDRFADLSVWSNAFPSDWSPPADADRDSED